MQGFAKRHGIAVVGGFSTAAEFKAAANPGIGNGGCLRRDDGGLGGNFGLVTVRGRAISEISGSKSKNMWMVLLVFLNSPGEPLVPALEEELCAVGDMSVTSDMFWAADSSVNSERTLELSASNRSVSGAVSLFDVSKIDLVRPASNGISNTGLLLADPEYDAVSNTSLSCSRCVVSAATTPSSIVNSETTVSNCFLSLV